MRCLASTALKPCTCGSGNSRRELVDAMGILCAFVCDACEPAKRVTFNLAIFEGGRYPDDEPIEPEHPDWDEKNPE